MTEVEEQENIGDARIQNRVEVGLGDVREEEAPQPQQTELHVRHCPKVYCLGTVEAQIVPLMVRPRVRNNELPRQLQ